MVMPEGSPWPPGEIRRAHEPYSCSVHYSVHTCTQSSMLYLVLLYEVLLYDKVAVLRVHLHKSHRIVDLDGVCHDPSSQSDGQGDCGRLQIFAALASHSPLALFPTSSQVTSSDEIVNGWPCDDALVFLNPLGSQANATTPYPCQPLTRVLGIKVTFPPPPCLHG